MKKALVLVVALAMLVCIIPFTDSSDADTDTTISGYIDGGRDITGAASIRISIIYSDDGITGKIVGSVDTVSPWTTTLYANKFSVTIQPEADHTITKYYIFFNIYGYSVKAVPTGFVKADPINVGGVMYSCYQMNGMPDITPGTDNPIGNETSGWFSMKTAEGTVTGKVSTKAAEPVYLNGVLVTLYDLNTKAELKSTTTHDGGVYSIVFNTGTYGISYELDGYKTEDMEITISEETPLTNNVTMKETQSYFGLDLPHALMILGGAAAVVLLQKECRGKCPSSPELRTRSIVPQ